MTNLEALIAECEPFTVSNRVAEKSLADTGLLSNDTYTSKIGIAKATVLALSRFLSLKSESEGSFSQSFDIEGLKARIKSLCSTAGIDASNFISQKTISDGSKFW